MVINIEVADDDVSLSATDVDIAEVVVILNNEAVDDDMINIGLL